MELLAGVPLEGNWNIQRSANIHGTALDLDPNASERDVVTYTFLEGDEDPAFSVLNRDHWQPRGGVQMAEWMAQWALAHLTDQALQGLTGASDSMQALADVSQAAGRGEAPWVSGRLRVRGRSLPAGSLVLERAGKRFEISDVGDRMVAVVHWDVVGAPVLGELAPFSGLDEIGA